MVTTAGSLWIIAFQVACMGKIENDARLGIYLKTMLDWV